MSKHTVWTCDRCHTTHNVAQRIVICDDDVFGPPVAMRVKPPHPPAWLELEEEETVTDVCPDCITADEHVDRLLHDVEATA